jgi:hypothetical protein
VPSHTPVAQSHGDGVSPCRHWFAIVPCRRKSWIWRSTAARKFTPECVPLSVAGGTFVVGGSGSLCSS